MDLPVSLAIERLASSEAGFSICYFKDKNHSPSAPPHYHVIITLGNGISLIVCIITSQVQSRGLYYINIGNVTALNSLVPLDPSNFGCITKPCVIECNSAKLFKTEQLISQISTNDTFRLDAFDSDFNPDLKKNILKAIINSNLVKEKVKKEIKSTFGVLAS